MRGKFVFATNAAAQCKTCHKAGDVGETLGPDLTKIGQVRQGGLARANARAVEND